MYEAVPIPEMNTALAVFMDLEKCGLFKCPTNHKGYVSLADLKYHSKWDWLMPVWLKIENAAQDVGISFKPYHIAFHVAIDQGDILAAHRACFDFIKRYNEIQSQTKA